MKIRRIPFLESASLNMTPMIDVVFQLIIFLMLATEITNTDLERLFLPEAKAALVDTDPPKDRVIVNITHDLPLNRDCPQLDYQNGKLVQPCLNPDHWKMMYQGRVLTQKELEELLVIIARPFKQNPDDPSCPSELPLMIRADGSAPYRFISDILEACGSAKIYKIEIGASVPEED